MNTTAPRIITRPLGPWTDPITVDRQRARFRAAWADTLDLLSREAATLGADLVVVQLDITEHDLRRDGLVRANTRIGFPGCRVSFTSMFGPLLYRTDRFDYWQDNVRAIALVPG